MLDLLSASRHQASTRDHSSEGHGEQVVARIASSGPDVLLPNEEEWDDRQYDAYDVEAFMRTVLSLDLPNGKKT